MKNGEKESYKLCSNFQISITKSKNFPGKYTAMAFLQNGENVSIGPYDINADILYTYSLRTNRRFSIIINEESESNQKVSTDILLVGFSGS